MDMSYKERSSSVVECSTRDRGFVGSSLTSVTSKTHLSLLSTGSTQEARPDITKKLLAGMLVQGIYQGFAE